MTPEKLLRGQVTVTVLGRSVRIRKLWLVVGPAVYLAGSAVVGTYLANHRTVRVGEADPLSPGQSEAADHLVAARES